MLTRKPFDFFRRLYIEVSGGGFLKGGFFFFFFCLLFIFPLALAEIPANLEGRTTQYLKYDLISARELCFFPGPDSSIAQDEFSLGRRKTNSPSL